MSETNKEKSQSNNTWVGGWIDVDVSVNATRWIRSLTIPGVERWTSESSMEVEATGGVAGGVISGEGV